MRKLARVFFEDGLRGLGRWRVEKNDCCHVFTERLRDAGELLEMLESCVRTHTMMPAWRAEKPSLTSSPVRPLTSFEAAQSSRTMSVGAFEIETGQLQPRFDMVLLADYHTQPRVSLAKPVQRSVIGESWANKNNVIKLALESAAELVHEKLGLARVGRASDQRVEWDIDRVHFNTSQNPAACL